MGLPPGGAAGEGNAAHLPVCRHFLRNRCKYGPYCRFRHQLTEVEPSPEPFPQKNGTSSNFATRAIVKCRNR